MAGNTEPETFSFQAEIKQLLHLMAETPRIVPYLDIPFQHVSDHILQLMNRPYTKNQMIRLMDAIRAAIPGAALRTTMMVGFPGESESDITEMAGFSTSDSP